MQFNVAKAFGLKGECADLRRSYIYRLGRKKRLKFNTAEPSTRRSKKLN